MNRDCKKHQTLRRWAAAVLVLFLLIISGFPENGGKTIQAAEELPDINTADIGVMTGSTAETFLQETYPDAVLSRFDNIADGVMALQGSKVDYVITAYTTALNYIRNNDDIFISRQDVMDESVAIAVAKENTGLLEAADSCLAGFEKDGTLDEVISHWIKEDGSPYDEKAVPELSDKDESFLTVGIAANREPMCFVKDNGYAGLDCELIERIAAELGKKVRYSDMQFSSLIAALQSGKVDVVISNMTATDERREMVSFTRDYFHNPQVLLAKKAAGTASADNDTAFFTGIKQSFDKTFLRESRWKLIASGLGVTCLISVAAALFGSLLGFGVCMMRRSRHPAASIPARVFVKAIQGTPIVVILMILYYVVFSGKFSLNPVAVAVIGFSVNFGAYVSEMIRTGIEAVDKGQLEAAAAMGYTKAAVFRKITFPQAAKHFLPVYRGEFISMVKMTSVVGYIAIQDLTKAGDIIRSRTYEAFFPLIVTAVIYFLLSSLLASVLTLAEKKIVPGKRKRIMPGIKQHTL